MRMHRAVLAATAVLALQLRAPGAGEPVADPGRQTPARDEALRQELLRMVEEDRASGACGRTSPSGLLLCRDTKQVREDNRMALDRIIAARGWPGRTLVGVDGQQAAWLIAQHADDDLPFQRHCLDLIRQAFVIGEAEANALAYLADRIRDNEGSPQMYGTQGVGVTSPEDELRVDANRKALGLEPWRVYVESVRKLSASGRRGIAPWSER